jgi:inhibitor of KinA sporulation pathway (predicted exonuclease)
MELTNIRQDQVSKAKTFDLVFPSFEDWFYDQDGPHLLCTWGDKDLPLIRDECRRHDVDDSFLPGWIDLKAQYARIYGLAKPVGLLKALEYIESPFEGSHHRAIDDAFNTTRLFLHLLDRWQY